MTIDNQVKAIRTTVGYWFPDNVSCVRLTGEHAFDLLDSICPANLFLQDGQMLHTVFLDESARPIADVYVCLDDEDFFLLAEGIEYSSLIAHFKRHESDHVDYTVVDLRDCHRLVSLSGPFAWEVAEKLLGPDVIGIPYMTFYHSGDILCFRGGKTGEYGYDFLVPEDEAREFISKLESLKEKFAMEQISRPALDVCMLENWFFNIAGEGAKDLTPLELQLQWRISYDKDYVGKSAIAERRDKMTFRVNTLLLDGEVAEESAIVHGDVVVGKILRCEWSPILEEHVGLGLLELAYAHSGLDCYHVLAADGAVSVRTVSPPVINNRSLYVSPDTHSFATRVDHDFPPLNFHSFVK